MSDNNLIIVFVHGFRGDHTSFQSFPIDLHLHLTPLIPGLNTFVYPTYKTKRPLEVARDALLDWMLTLPPGRVILCGHSMGGLLTAEVAFAAPPGRVIGLVSFDAPYLGVHPRVVKSGLASLFTKRERTTVQDVDQYQRESPSTSSIRHFASETSIPHHSNPRSPIDNESSGIGGNSPSATSLSSTLHLSAPLPPIRAASPKLERLFQTCRLGPIPQSVHNLLHFFDKHPGFRGAINGIVQIFEFGGCLLNPQGLVARYERMQRWGSDQRAGPYGRGWVNLWTTPVPCDTDKGHESSREVCTHQTSLATEGRFDSPSPEANSIHISSLTQSKTTLDSGFMEMSPSQPSHDPASSTIQLDRASLGDESRETELQGQQSEDSPNEVPLYRPGSHTDSAPSVLWEPTKKATKTLLQGRHSKTFIVLPRKGTDQQWIRIPVIGAENEIAAHCGLFFREENPGYDILVEDVGNLVRIFWDGEGGLRHRKRSF